MAHILLVLAPAAQGPDALETSVARALADIQAERVSLPIMTGSVGRGAWGVLGFPGESGDAAPSLAPLAKLDVARALRLSLPALTLELTEDTLRAETDIVGSRTLWYVQQDGTLLVSTSQRALIRWLGDFQAADRAVGWFILTGSLGPETSWDRRVRPLPPGGTLRFDRSSQNLQITRPTTPRFVAPARPSAGLRSELCRALRVTVDQIPRSPRAALSLSGGLDSTLLVHLVGRDRSLSCLTWGAADALLNPVTDPAVAQRTAQRYGASFHFLPIRPVPLDEALDAFVAASEGRVDHVTGYLDGLALWRSLAAELGVQLLVRGDEAFGWVPVLTAADVRRSVGAPELRDYGNESFLRRSGFDELALPSLPEPLQRRGETLPTWRDRLYQEFRIPSILAALTTVKAGYVETYNPFLDPRILELVARLPDAERTDKRFVRRVASELVGRHPSARADGAVTMSRGELAPLAMRALEGSELGHHLPPRLRHALRLLATAEAKPTGTQAASGQSLRTKLGLRLPTWVRRVARNTVAREELGASKLLLRAVLLSRTVSLLHADSQRSKDGR